MLNPSLSERDSPFQSGFSALDPTQAEVPSVGATHPASEGDEDQALQTVLLMSPVLPSQLLLEPPPGLGTPWPWPGVSGQAHQHLISF